MNREDYSQKLHEILSDTTKFTQLIDDPTEKREAKLQRFLYTLHKKGQIGKETYDKIRPVGSTPSKLYGLPKIHKSGNPLRPIISQIGSYTYELAKFLVPILAPLAKNEFTVKDSFAFVQDLQNHGNIPFMCSLIYVVGSWSSF